MKTSSGTSWPSSYCSRWPLKSRSTSAASQSETCQDVAKPGHSSEQLASSAQNDVSTLTSSATRSPPGTRYGRGTSGYLRRRMYSAGKMNRYAIVVVEIASPSATVKYFAVSPEVSSKAPTNIAVAKMPESRLTTIGVPQ